MALNDVILKYIEVGDEGTVTIKSECSLLDCYGEIARKLGLPDPALIGPGHPRALLDIASLFGKRGADYLVRPLSHGSSDLKLSRGETLYYLPSEPFELTLLVHLGEQNGWPVGAKLLAQWFKGPKNTVPKLGTPDKTTITMGWVLGFERARKVYDTMIRDKIWCNLAAKKLIIRKIRAGRPPLVALTDPALMDQHVIQERQVGSTPNDAWRVLNQGSAARAIDDLDFALHHFQFRMAIDGKITTGPGPNRRTVRIEQVGIYVYEEVEFDRNDQDLFCWNPLTGKVTFWKDEHSTKISNASFRRWRKKHGKGCNYLVYSFPKITAVNDTFDFNFTFDDRYDAPALPASPKRQYPQP
jgi:hypothetical protein